MTSGTAALHLAYALRSSTYENAVCRSMGCLLSLARNCMPLYLQVSALWTGRLCAALHLELASECEDSYSPGIQTEDMSCVDCALLVTGCV